MQIYRSLDELKTNQQMLGKSMNGLVYTAEVEFEGAPTLVKVKQYNPARFFVSDLLIDESKTDEEVMRSVSEERLTSVRSLFTNAGTELCEMKHAALAKVVGVLVPNDSLHFGVVSAHHTGQTLKEILSTEAGRSNLAAVPLSVRMQWIQSIADALQYLHSFKKLHRNLHNTNILIDLEHQTVLVVDYFAEWFYVEEATSAPSKLDPKLMLSTYTMKQSPPELLLKRGYSSASDVWCLGLLMFQLLFCEEPFKGVQEKEFAMKLLKENLQPKASVNLVDQLSTEELKLFQKLEAIMTRSMQLVPKNRASIADILEALN